MSAWKCSMHAFRCFKDQPRYMEYQRLKKDRDPNPKKAVHSFYDWWIEPGSTRVYVGMRCIVIQWQTSVKPNRYIPCVLWWVPKVKRTPRETLKNTIKRGVKLPTQNRNTTSWSKLPKPPIGIRIFLFQRGGHEKYLKRLNAHLGHQVQPINVALQRLVQRDWSVLESAKCICIFVQVAWSMSDPREYVKSSHEHKVVGQDLWHANCHGNPFCRSGICCTIVSALNARERAPCARQRPVNAKRQSKLGQKFPYSDVLLHIRSNPAPVFAGFGQWILNWNQTVRPAANVARPPKPANSEDAIASAVAVTGNTGGDLIDIMVEVEERTSCQAWRAATASASINLVGDDGSATPNQALRDFACTAAKSVLVATKVLETRWILVPGLRLSSHQRP